MNNNNAISVCNVEKSFKVYADKANTLRERVVTRGRSSHKKAKVLNGVSFDIRKGEVVGLIGENGCGKSTALKLISRIIYPDSGVIEVKGRVSSLLELGAGFHAELSGRENIYTNASIFGLSKKEIDERINTIIDFSELWDFIDSPVRTYSSGMYTRLAFSVAINVNAEVLLIDEILAVGDSNFQRKCFNKLRELKAQNVTIILVTHDTSTVEDFCSRAIWLNNGLVAADGNPSDVVNSYLDYMFEKQLLMDERQKEEQRKAERAKKDFTREDITELYLKYLKRLPDNDKTFDSYFDAFNRKKDVENSIKNSPEHRALVLIERQRKEAEAVPGISREDVIEIYRTYLHRLPESEHVIEACCKAYRTEDELAACILNSPEYRIVKQKDTQCEATLVEETSDVVKRGVDPKRVQIVGLRIAGTRGEEAAARCGSPLNIQIKYKLATLERAFHANVDIYTSDSIFCFGVSSEGIECDWESGTILCRMPVLPLTPGNYKLYATIQDEVGTVIDKKRIYIEVLKFLPECAEQLLAPTWECTGAKDSPKSK